MAPLGVQQCTIDSQKEDGLGQVDWRLEHSSKMNLQPVQLPEQINQQCLTLISTLGLNFGCIDMIVTPENEYVFLEVNANGQWLWIEEATALPISKAIADLLMSNSLK